MQLPASCNGCWVNSDNNTVSFFSPCFSPSHKTNLRAHSNPNLAACAHLNCIEDQTVQSTGFGKCSPLRKKGPMSMVFFLHKKKKKSQMFARQGHTGGPSVTASASSPGGWGRMMVTLGDIARSCLRREKQWSSRGGEKVSENRRAQLPIGLPTRHCEIPVHPNPSTPWALALSPPRHGEVWCRCLQRGTRHMDSMLIIRFSAWLHKPTKGEHVNDSGRDPSCGSHEIFNILSLRKNPLGKIPSIFMLH